MKQNGKLTRAEQQTVSRALAIIDQWVAEHLDDDERPHAWTDVAFAAHALEECMWAMFDE